LKKSIDFFPALIKFYYFGCYGKVKIWLPLSWKVRAAGSMTSARLCAPKWLFLWAPRFPLCLHFRCLPSQLENRRLPAPRTSAAQLGGLQNVILGPKGKKNLRAHSCCLWWCCIAGKSWEAPDSWLSFSPRFSWLKLENTELASWCHLQKQPPRTARLKNSIKTQIKVLKLILLWERKIWTLF